MVVGEVTSAPSPPPKIKPPFGSTTPGRARHSSFLPSPQTTNETPPPTPSPNQHLRKKWYFLGVTTCRGCVTVLSLSTTSMLRYGHTLHHMRPSALSTRPTPRLLRLQLLPLLLLLVCPITHLLLLSPTTTPTPPHLRLSYSESRSCTNPC